MPRGTPWQRRMPTDLRAMTPEARLQLFVELCDLTDSIVDERPNSSALRAPAGRTPESEALWRRLMQARHGR